MQWSKWKLVVAVLGLLGTPLGAWLDIRLAVARLETHATDSDRRLDRIERVLEARAAIASRRDDDE